MWGLNRSRIVRVRSCFIDVCAWHRLELNMTMSNRKQQKLNNEPMSVRSCARSS